MLQYVLWFLGGFVQSIIIFRIAYRQGAKHQMRMIAEVIDRQNCPHGVPFKYKWEIIVNRSGDCQECHDMDNL